MGFNCGIVGLPNVGKSTIFNALTSAGAESANYPFCTIDPNKGIAEVPDERLQKLAGLYHPEKILPAAMEFVDIAGLVKGASKGEGLGNQFLGHIRSVDAIAHVVRCFEDPDVVHVSGSIDPARDIDTIHTELILADLDGVSKRLDKLARFAKLGQKDAVEQSAVLEKVRAGLDSVKKVSELGLSAEEKAIISDLELLTIKPMFYVCNVDETGLREDSSSFKIVKARGQSENVPVIKLCGKVEAEVAELDPGDRKTFLQDYGLDYSGLESMARTGFDLLGLITYFTCGPKEVRAWTITQGTLAPQAAGVIHTDFEKGFIKAEVFHCEDIFRLGSAAKVKEAGLLRQEGKEYLVKDGDVILFRFNV